MISEKTFSYVNLLLKWCRTVKPALFILVPTARTNWQHLSAMLALPL